MAKRDVSELVLTLEEIQSYIDAEPAVREHIRAVFLQGLCGGDPEKWVPLKTGIARIICAAYADGYRAGTEHEG